MTQGSPGDSRRHQHVPSSMCVYSVIVETGFCDVQAGLELVLVKGDLEFLISLSHVLGLQVHFTTTGFNRSLGCE